MQVWRAGECWAEDTAGTEAPRWGEAKIKEADKGCKGLVRNKIREEMAGPSPKALYAIVKKRAFKMETHWKVWGSFLLTSYHGKC